MFKFKIVGRALATVATIAVLASPEAAAQTDSNWVSATATVSSVFDFRIDGADWSRLDPAVYDFGSVSHTGMNGGVIIAGRAYYTANGAFTWSVESAPRRTVDVSFQNATKLVEPAAGAMDLDQLAIRLTITAQASGGVGTSTGLTALSTGKEVLVDDVLCGVGSSTGSGNIDLELYVDGNDRQGVNTWEIELVAEGI
ncbi:MAG: hypothetical protein KY459_13165 [Acidobacteria bacterium]|nr:hypothetical protein [Acidobacteriota bacterium]